MTGFGRNDAGEARPRASAARAFGRRKRVPQAMRIGRTGLIGAGAALVALFFGAGVMFMAGLASGGGQAEPSLQIEFAMGGERAPLSFVEESLAEQSLGDQAAAALSGRRSEIGDVASAAGRASLRLPFTAPPPTDPTRETGPGESAGQAALDLTPANSAAGPGAQRDAPAGGDDASAAYERESLVANRALVAPSRPARADRPRIAVVIDDLGIRQDAARRAAGLPGPLTLSFFAYPPESRDIAVQARGRGHEIWLHLPMEPANDADPGPMPLLAGFSADELKRRIDWHLTRMPEAVGVNNHMGSLLTKREGAMAAVMEELKGRGLLFLDSLTTPDSVAGAAAAVADVPYASRDVFLDSIDGPTDVRAMLQEAERIADATGAAVVIAHPHDDTLDALAPWLVSAPLRGIEIVPLSELILTPEPETQTAAQRG